MGETGWVRGRLDIRAARSKLYATIVAKATGGKHWC
jgi:hypothetical protein